MTNPNPPHPFKANDQLSDEEILIHVDDLLRWIGATVYECADNSKGAERDLAFSALHKAQLARTLMDILINRCSPA
jgi:hypothetical protein